MPRRLWFSTVGVAWLAMLSVATAPATQGAVSVMPPLSKVSVVSAAEQSRIRHLYSTSPLVRYTFDDCADQTRLTALLRSLSSHNVQAIFFFTGTCMRLHPTYPAQIVHAQQLLGNHSYDHPSYLKLTTAQIYSQVRRSYSVVPTTSVKLCRPPYGDGAFNLRVYNALAAAGCRPAFWTVDTRDWSGSTAATIVRRVRTGDAYTPPVKAGGVILMHGTGRYTLAAQQGVYDAIRARGLTSFAVR
jgi:peptidoglycan/xylan/chitin deacetylase (PgdA/CDA1 family)